MPGRNIHRSGEQLQVGEVCWTSRCPFKEDYAYRFGGRALPGLEKIGQVDFLARPSLSKLPEKNC